MGMKRSFADVDSQDHDSTSRSAASRGNGFDPKRRKQHGTGNPKVKEGRLGFAKKRIRNIERLLERNKDLPADVQNDLQRELATLKATVSDKSFHRKRSAMISKYHMVRFFERKKASRLAKQIRRTIEQNPESDGIDHLKRQLHIAEVDEAYTVYHPHMEPYHSLYGSVRADSKEKQDGGESEDEAMNQTPVAKVALDSERPPMWYVVEKTMEQGIEALQQLRERRPNDASASTTKPSRVFSKASQSRSDNKKQDKLTARHAANEKSGIKDKDKATSCSQRQKQTGEKTPLNRRERRRLMREAEAEKNSEDEEEGGGFFEGL
ncbi:hypothetical protein C2857_006074 [Epichloe festucae Fl1]|uniref:rRNA-processing protein EFG1 n=1 Tax=Epichloe festucae (strain Fl1) TaxID=877507 RepID=A0A7S9KT88_EPIFF|nr:hypothetical protein C2857_006074 [Epichloe festucae Fl1]